MRMRIADGSVNQDNFHECVEPVLHLLLATDLRQLVDNQEFTRINSGVLKRLVNVGGVLVGGNEPCVVQSMALGSLQIENIDKLCKEFIELADAGSQIIRIACISQSDAANMRLLKEKLFEQDFRDGTQYGKIPVVMCGQYNVAPIIKETDILRHIAKLRINPGNIAIHSKDYDNFKETISHLVEHNKGMPDGKKICVRIGVNWGSLDEKLKTLVMDINSRLAEPRNSAHVERVALVISAISSGLYAELLGLSADLIVISCKTSTVVDTYVVTKLLHHLCDYPIHLGVTEAGQGDDGVVLTACGIAPLLLQGIGSTLRVSLTPRMNESRTKEVIICRQILQSVGVRQFRPKTTSCPGCGRTDSTFFRRLAEQADEFIQSNLEEWCRIYKNEKIRGLKVAVMGCLVNGEGESKHADIGISLPGFRESNVAIVYLDRAKHCVLRADNLGEDGSDIAIKFFEIIEKYVAKRFCEDVKV